MFLYYLPPTNECFFSMRQIEAIRQVMQLDTQGIHVFTKKDLAKVFREDSAHALDASLVRLVNNGVLSRVAKGVYVNALSPNRGRDTIELIAVALRRGEYSYVSLESALSEYGVISQIPMRLTVMTTGRRGEYNTPFGTIEFTHTARPWLDVVDGVLDRGRPLRFAARETAYRDLKRVGRNLHLVDESVLYEQPW